ncbi:gephyrin-like molybdotransferase Glp [Chromatocurvus halotolerans]|uniref:Molybdopterin molybdenumtransferase n=1 Tax=Chromatocurvus halotolerans TaxID=1132028 RepID=A0A4R2KGK9_9GAMM|nr:gephyrin-like molybdotransferase Glp [Chromatocurvus halotolerans]TCO71427.1 molybdopterin molybdochelatase [Chromatocurvus halotolerans]
MLSPSLALARMLAAAIPPPPAHGMQLADALGATLAVDVTAPLALPAFDNSAMDGYALRASDVADGRSLPVSQRILAGQVPLPLTSGTAARIFTGAPLPEGADSVMMQEACAVVDGSVRPLQAVTVGSHVRRRGEDVAQGSLLLPRGRRLRPQDLGLLASVGMASVEVYRPLRVAILVTGDELREPGGPPLRAGEIFNSNGPMLSAMVRRCGLQAIETERVADSEQAVAQALGDAAAAADVIVSTGGVSVGEADHVRSQVERLGALSLWRIAIKPGKPLAFGRVGDVPFIGLPGNPSSVFVTFAVLARPFLLACQGRDEREMPRLTVRAGFSVTSAGTREEYLRVTLLPGDDGTEAVLAGNQSSGALSAATRAQALAVVPPDTLIAPGDAVDVILLDALVP